MKLAAALSVVFVAQFALGGCVPIPTKYYVPHGGGKVIKTGCFAEAYAALAVDIGLREKMYIGAIMPATNLQPSKLQAVIQLYPDETARFDTATVIVMRASAAKPISEQIDHLDVSYVGADPLGGPPRLATQSATNAMVGGPPAHVERRTDFSFELKLPFDTPQDFTAIIPAITVGDKRVEVGPIAFTVDKTIYMLSLFCP